MKTVSHSSLSRLPEPGTYVRYYLPLSDEMFHCGFYVTSCGYSTIGAGTPYPPVKHPTLYHFEWDDGRVLPEFSLMLITAGEGVFESEATGTVPLKPGLAVFLFPGIWHRYRPNLKTGWTERWMHFNGEFAHLLLDQKIISSELAIVSSKRWKEIDTALRHQLAHIQEAPSSNSLLISLEGLHVLALAISQGPRAVNSKKDVRAKNAESLVSAAVDYIWARSHHVLNVSDVADALKVTRRTLERQMLAGRGHSVLDEIIQCRFTRAERLLRETSLPIKTVVDLAGFGSPENMRQMFLTRLKFSPHDYRRQLALKKQV
jgi:AraC-like DNA-binding protein